MCSISLHGNPVKWDMNMDASFFLFGKKEEEKDVLAAKLIQG